MKRVVVLVEGQTEEALVDEVLAPAALARGSPRTSHRHHVGHPRRRAPRRGLIPARGLTRLRREIARGGGPERIDHGPSTAPSKRLLRADPGYLKTVTGPLLVAEAGLSAVLARCPTFAAWWEDLLS